jgi:uncharacterized protein YwgA
MDNSEKLAIQGTQDEEKQDKNTTMCWKSQYTNKHKQDNSKQTQITQIRHEAFYWK